MGPLVDDDPVTTVTNLISQLKSFTRDLDHMLGSDGQINPDEVHATVRRLQSYAARLNRVVSDT